MGEKAAYNMLVKLTKGLHFTNIYEQLFHTKVFCTTFTCLQFGFVIFWRKEIGKKLIVCEIDYRICALMKLQFFLINTT